MAHDKGEWTEVLPMVMMGIRSAVKEDLGFSSAELVFGHNLTLPADIVNQEQSNMDHETFIQKLKNKITTFSSTDTRPITNQDIYVPKTLLNCTHVFVRKDTGGCLDRPYLGPF